MNRLKREYTINLLAGRSNAVEPCVGCEHKYKCDAERLACAQFRYFVNTSYLSDVAHRTPTRAIYMDIFYKEPEMNPRKERA
jgi:hypothetical protein